MKVISQQVRFAFALNAGSSGRCGWVECAWSEGGSAFARVQQWVPAPDAAYCIRPHL